MTIKDMHYDFKKKFNKVDSQKNRNLLVPEIDWFLNEAEEIFIKIVAFPKFRTRLGFEVSQRTIDDIYSIVVESSPITVAANIIALPPDYRYFARCRVLMTKGACVDAEGVLFIREHRDLFEESSFYKGSFEWREVNGIYQEAGIRTFTDGTFTITEAILTYIRKTEYMHNAADFPGGTYTLPSGIVLTATSDCELPEQTHREIVDIAVALAAGEIQTSDYQIKMNKLSLNQIV
jgi:hypothetical protein